MSGFLKTMMVIVVIISLLNSGISISGTDQTNSRVSSIDPESELQSNPSDEKTDSYSSYERSGRNVLTFDEGKDTFLCDSFDMYGHEEKNFGGDPVIWVSYDASVDEPEHFFPFRGMIKFDFSGIPTDTEIISANMKLYYGDCEEGESVPLTITAYPLTRDWTEGTGTWEQFGVNGATWKTYDGNNAWDTPGGDYDDQKGVAATTPGGYGWVTWDIKSIFQEWSDGTLDNHGLLLITKAAPNQRTIKFLNSFNGMDSKPVLEIRYNKPPTAFIDSVEPNPVKEFRNVTFTGHGEDPDDGTTNSGFIWMLKNEYIPTIVVGNQAISTVDNLTQGTYEVSFRVRDNFGAWSPDVTLNEPLVVSADEPPDKIDDLVAEAHGGLSGAINLTWKAVAEDGSHDDGKATRYIIKYSNGYMDSVAAFNNAEDLESKMEIPEPKKPGGREELTITGFNKGTEHFFAVVAVDERGQRSPISNIVRAIAPDHNPPGVISDLSAESGEGDGEIDLLWTAPGDDGLVGQADRYEIKCSQERIRTIWDFYSADEVPNSDEVPAPNHAGSRESFIVTGLERREIYYFAIKTMDKWDNVGPLSIVAHAQATDRTAPSAVTGVYGFDTPDDIGQSITINWDISEEEDFDHYSIYVAMTTITDVSLLTPVKTVNDRNVGATRIIGSTDMSLVDRREYYVAVTAVDDNNNMNPEVICYGPVMSLNNLKKAQPLTDPVSGTTYERKGISDNPAVEVKITKLEVTINTEEIDDKFVSITTVYDIEGTSAVPGDQIDHIDIYDHMRDGEGDWYWSPIMDHVSAEELDDTEPDYVDKLYELFLHPDISQDIWSLIYQHTRIVEKEELALLGIGEDAEEYGMNEICVVAWTVTAEWNYLVQEYEQRTNSIWLDSDKDGLADQWEEKYFKSISEYFALDDADGDGFSNLVEFQENTIPTDANSHPQGTPDKTIDKVDKSSSGLGDQGWLLWAILVIIIMGLVVIAVILVIKRSKASPYVEPVKLEEESIETVPPEIKETPVEPEMPKTTFIPPVIQQQAFTQSDCETCGKPLEYDSHTGDWYCQSCEADPNTYVDLMVAAEAEIAEEFPEPKPMLPALPPHLADHTEDEDGEEPEGGNEVREKLQEARAMLEKAPSFIDITGPMAILDRAEEEIKGNDNEKASTSIEESTKMALGIRERYGELVKQSEKILEEAQTLKDKENDTSQIEELFTSGKSSLMGGDFDLCEEKFMSALQVIENIKEGASESKVVEKPSQVASPVVKAPAEKKAVETLKQAEIKEATEQPESVGTPEEPETVETPEQPEAPTSPEPVSSEETTEDNLDDMLDGLLEDL